MGGVFWDWVGAVFDDIAAAGVLGHDDLQSFGTRLEAALTGGCGACSACFLEG